MAINIEIDGDHLEVLGVDRCHAIAVVLQCIAEEEVRLSYLVAVTGAMRWPLSLRPEVLIGACCDAL
jgi:hypothetical protein